MAQRPDTAVTDVVGFHAAPLDPTDYDVEARSWQASLSRCDTGTGAPPLTTDEDVGKTGVPIHTPTTGT
jgi:hypothetical protein